MKKYQLKNLGCALCAAKIEENLRKLEYIRFVSVDFATSSLVLDADNLDKKELDKIIHIIQDVEPEVELKDTSDSKKYLISGSELKEQRSAIIKVSISLVLLITGIILESRLHESASPLFEYLLFGAAYLVAGWNVIAMAAKNIIRGNVFNEHFLMTIATLGAFAIHELTEAVAVMLFYVVGEFFQDIAVDRSRKSIKSLLELKPGSANLLIDGSITSVVPESVQAGDIVIVRPGEKVPLDGEIIEGLSFVDTSALTGESVPAEVNINDHVLAGMINLSGLLTVKVTRLYSETSISRILELVESASARKAGTEKFITRFARYYTPVIVFSALLIAFLPPIIFTGQTFEEWIYRALVVLVVSCPCALIISIPLGYFGGIGAASRKGILIKGSNFLDALTKVKTIVFDKTGTLTRGEFKVSEVVTSKGFSRDQILYYAAHAESHSNHPVARSIQQAYGRAVDNSVISDVQEKAGHGIISVVEGKIVIAGNDKLMRLEQIDHPAFTTEGTVVYLAVDNVYAGSIVISDRLKNGALETIRELKKRGIDPVMLTGDNRHSADAYAKKLEIERYYAELLPEEKVKYMEFFLTHSQGKVAFAGDGINDAPVLARADVGISIGSLASDVAIETADVVIMSDNPKKITEALDIAGKTRTIIWQNILFALAVKAFFIILGIAGIATMWEAVFGDMGVALLAVFNAMRISGSKN